MKQYNCKNCGAPIEHSYNHKCPFCGTLFDFNEPIENIVEVKPEDLINIELKDISCEMPKVFEYNSNGVYISKVENYINPPKCGFCIEIPIYKIKQYGIDYIMSSIRSTGVRYNELNNIFDQVKKRIINYVRC